MGGRGLERDAGRGARPCGAGGVRGAGWPPGGRGAAGGPAPLEGVRAPRLARWAHAHRRRRGPFQLGAAVEIHVLPQAGRLHQVL